MGACSLTNEDETGETALHKAAANGHLAAVEFLVEQGADVEALDYTCGTPLVDAVYFRHPEIARYLMSKGANVNHAHVDASRTTPLMFASSQGCVEIVKDLLANGADVTMSDDDDVNAMGFWDPRPGGERGDVVKCDGIGISDCLKRL